MRGSRRSSPRLHGEPSPRPLRRPRSIPFPPRPNTGATVRGTLRRARLAATRDFPRREAIARLAACARASVRDRSARRSSLLPADAATDRARAPWLPAGRRHRAGRAGGGSRAHRSAPRAIEDRGDPRPPRRLARAGQALRSKARRLLAPFADALARIALRRADAVRTISAYTTELVRAEGIEPAAEFPAFMDLEPFTALPVAPLPDAPRALFVGVLERYKAFDVLADAWRSSWPAAPKRLCTSSVRGAGVDCAAARGRAAGSRRVDSVSDDRRSRGRARRVDAARAPVSLGGDGARGGRSRVPWPGRRRAAAWAAYRTSSRTARQVYSSRPTTPERWLRHSSAYSPIERSRNVSAAAGHRAVAPWLVTPQEYAQRVRDLVEKVVAAS